MGIRASPIEDRGEKVKIKQNKSEAATLSFFVPRFLFRPCFSPLSFYSSLIILQTQHTRAEEQDNPTYPTGTSHQPQPTRKNSPHRRTKQMQQEHEHHLLLNLNSHNQNHDDSSSSFVGQADNSSSHHHHHHQPITTAPKYTKRQQDRTTQPSLWNTKEFYVYYLVFMFCVPYMFKTAHEASSGTK